MSLSALCHRLQKIEDAEADQVHIQHSGTCSCTLQRVGLCYRPLFARRPPARCVRCANGKPILGKPHGKPARCSVSIVDSKRGRPSSTTHHRTATGVHKRRPHKAPEDPSLHSGLSGQRQRHGRAGARWRCTVCRIRFAIADSGKSASNECGTSGPSDLYSGPQNVTAHACVHMTHATIMQHAK